MNREDILKLWSSSGGDNVRGMPYDIIEEFAQLVAAAEREQIDQLVNDDKELSDLDAIRLSRAICARGQQ